MTAPESPTPPQSTPPAVGVRQPLLPISGEFAYDLADPANPLVLMILGNGGMRAQFTIPPRAVNTLAAHLANGLMQAAAEAIANAGPQIVVPSSGLIVPGR